MATTHEQDGDHGFGDVPNGGDDGRGRERGDTGPCGGGDSSGADPSPERLRALHAACLGGGQHKAFALAVDLLYVRLVRRVSARSRFRRVDPQLVADGVTEALAEYAKRPAGFNPSAGVPLDRHLQRAAERDVLNLLRSEARRHRREQKAAEAAAADHAAKPVELQSPVGNMMSDEADARLERDRQRLLALFPDPADRRVLELRLAGERRTAAFAEAMGIGHLPPAEQKQQVKRAKDRIDKVVRRVVRPDEAGGDHRSGSDTGGPG